jgi:hypothetical protein
MFDSKKRPLLLKTNQPRAKTTQPMKKIHYLNIALLTATLFVRNQANAAIVYSEIQNVAYSQFADPGAFSLFNAPGNWDDIRLELFVSEGPSRDNSYEFFNMLNIHGNYVEFAVGSGFLDIKNFSSGATIDSSSVWSGNSYKDFSSFTERFGPFPSTFENGEFRNTNGYAGMRLTDGANVYYGWIQVSVTNYNNSGITGTLIDWAYDNTPGQAIQAAAVPEPSTAGLLFGAAAIYCLVRRRRR